MGEEKIAKNSQTNNNETKSLINDLVEKQNVSSQQIKELDKGNQGLLEKLLNLEKNLGDGFSTLEATDKNIGENVNSLNKDLAALKEDIGLKMKGINDNSDGIAERVSSLDGDFKSNLEKVIRLEESMHIQIENTKKIENERQTDALRAKEEIELMNAANSKSFATFQTQISEKVHIIEGNLKSLEDSSNQAALNLGNGFDDKLKVMKNEVDGKIDVNVQQIKELDMGNQGLLEKLLGLEKTLGGNSNSIANLEDQFAKKISTVQDELKSIEKSSTESANNLESGLSEKFKVMKDDVDKKIEKSSQLLDSQATDLEKKIKANTDNIKNLEDSLDGLRSTVDGQEVKHSSIDAKFNEFNIQINERFNASEEKIAKNSQTSNNETKSQINDLVEKQNVSSQQIKELDQGNQGLLEKLLNLEKNLGDGFSTLEATDKNIGENVNSLNKDLAALKEDIGLKMKGINDNSDGIEKRVSSLDGDFKSNLEKVIRLEESMHIQIENTKKIENERQTDALRAKEEIELMNAANSKSFATFQTQISEKVHIIEGNLKSLEDSSNQAALNLGNGFDDKLKVMKNEVDGKIDVNVQQIKELDMGNQGLLEKLLDLEKNLGGNSNSIANLEDQFAKKISTVQDELKSIEKSSTESANNLESGLSEKFKVMKDDVDKKIEKSSQLLDSQATDLEKKIKANTANIKNLEDPLD